MTQATFTFPSSWRGTRVLVVGLARSGRSVCLWLAGQGAHVTGNDRKLDPPGVDALREAGVELILGQDALEALEQTQLMVLSPGVPDGSPMVQAARRLGVPILGELALAARAVSVPIMAITGTNGKSTTTSLCAHLLRSGGLKAFVGGNIGKPLSDLLLEDEGVDWAVVEVSSFQLEHLAGSDGLAPKVGIWLNLTPDHLDRHGDMANYGDIKLRMFGGQTAEDSAIYFADDGEIPGRMRDLACRKVAFSRTRERLGHGDIWIEGQALHVLGSTLVFHSLADRLAGDHNAENAAAAVAAALSAGVAAEAIVRGLESYPGLPHRLEPVRELSGVRYINDSKGTNAEATAKSLTSFSSPVILIAGGKGKGSGYRSLRQVVKERVAHLVLLGADAQRLAEDLEGCAELHHVQDMAEAVALGQRLAKPGQIVLLSPACASFDMFDDYEHRGRVFAELVRELGE